MATDTVIQNKPPVSFHSQVPHQQSERSQELSPFVEGNAQPASMGEDTSSTTLYLVAKVLANLSQDTLARTYLVREGAASLSMEDLPVRSTAANNGPAGQAGSSEPVPSGANEPLMVAHDCPTSAAASTSGSTPDRTCRRLHRRAKRRSGQRAMCARTQGAGKLSSRAPTSRLT